MITSPALNQARRELTHLDGIFLASDMTKNLWLVLLPGKTPVAIHDKPIINACLPTQEGYGQDFWVPIHEVPTFPTSTRVNATGAGRLVTNELELQEALSAYLADPSLDSKHRRQFLQQELTFLAGEGTRQTANFLLGLVDQPKLISSEDK